MVLLTNNHAPCVQKHQGSYISEKSSKGHFLLALDHDLRAVYRRTDRQDTIVEVREWRYNQIFLLCQEKF